MKRCLAWNVSSCNVIVSQGHSVTKCALTMLKFLSIVTTSA